MYKISCRLLIFFICLSFASSIQANDGVLKKTFSTKYTNLNNLNNQKYFEKKKGYLSNVTLNYKDKSYDTNLNLIHNAQNKLLLDNTYLQKETSNIILRFGSKDMNWSYSPKSSLVLSSHSRPLNSIYFKARTKNKLKINWLPSIQAASLELYNGKVRESIDSDETMLFGIRSTISTTNNFHIEALRMLQWGGYANNDPSVLFKSFFSNTNDGEHHKINQLAGIGLSFTVPNKKYPLRVYTQIVGEDEAGNLPSCLFSLTGTEWQGLVFKHPAKIGIEYIDTRVDYTTHGNCGPNTAYNNSFYKYRHYGTVLGAPIDTEGKSVEFFGNADFSQYLTTHFSFKKVLINSSNWSGHSLSSGQKEGWENTIALSFKKNNYTITGRIHSQNYDLEKINSFKGFGITLSSSFDF